MGYKTRVSKKNKTNKTKKNRFSKKNGGGMFDGLMNLFGAPKSDAMKKLDEKEKECVETIRLQKEELKKLEADKAASAQKTASAPAATAPAPAPAESNPMTYQKPVEAPKFGGKRRKSRKNRR